MIVNVRPAQFKRGDQWGWSGDKVLTITGKGVVDGNDLVVPVSGAGFRSYRFNVKETYPVERAVKTLHWKGGTYKGARPARPRTQTSPRRQTKSPAPTGAACGRRKSGRRRSSKPVPPVT